MWKCSNCGTAADLAPEDFPLTCGCGTRYASRKARGVGDIVAKLTHAVGLETCGKCAKRRKRLNEMFPFSSDEKTG